MINCLAFLLIALLYISLLSSNLWDDAIAPFCFLYVLSIDLVGNLESSVAFLPHLLYEAGVVCWPLCPLHRVHDVSLHTPISL